MFVLFIIFQENHTPQVINVYNKTTKFIADENFSDFSLTLINNGKRRNSRYTEKYTACSVF
jgi:hypothetical protein